MDKVGAHSQYFSIFCTTVVVATWIRWISVLGFSLGTCGCGRCCSSVSILRIYTACINYSSFITPAHFINTAHCACKHGPNRKISSSNSSHGRMQL